MAARRARDRRSGPRRGPGRATEGAETEPRRKARHRVEHAGLVRPDQLPRLSALGVTVVVQPSFLRHYGDDYATIMGEDRAGWLYQGRGFLDHGVRVAGSSDRAVANGAPLRAIQFMVERTSESGRLIGAEKRSRSRRPCARAPPRRRGPGHWETDAGTLTPGKRADLVVLGDDPRRVEVSHIGEIEVVRTFVEGRGTF
ncbi:amidohydrolase family protein [Streptomyces scabiei]|uniref:amidohydrolase family protein n=1 Tax=Streptomyces scabiei TaxID=1930 RepID=UPI0039F12FB6